MQELEGDIPYFGKGEELSYPKIAKESGMNLPPSGSVTLECDSKETHLCGSKHGTISCCHFEIERESFICALCDLDEPASYEKALNSHTSNKWLVAMREEMSYI